MRKKVRLANNWIRRRPKKQFHHILNMFGVSLAEYMRSFKVRIDSIIKNKLIEEKKHLSLKEIKVKYNLNDYQLENALYKKNYKKVITTFKV